MAGNVWEWCLTEYVSGSQESYSNEGRVVRGGSWNSYEYFVRTGYRDYFYPVDRYRNAGFRVAASFAPIQEEWS